MSGRLTDEQIGENVRKARERAGLPQQHIATVMAMSHGFAWHQTTVGRMEAGSRPLKLTEAVAVADIIGVTLADLVGGERDAAIVELAALADRIGERIAELRAS